MNKCTISTAPATAAESLPITPLFQPTKPAIGLDLGDKHMHFHVLTATGEFVQEGRIAMNQDAVKAFLASQPISRVAIEVGTHSRWVCGIAISLGHEVYVANPRKLRGIYDNDKKDDKVDARFIAEIVHVRPQLLRPIQHRGQKASQALTLLRARDVLVRSRTQLTNHVRGVVKAYGYRMKKCSASSFANLVDELPEETRTALAPVMEVLDELRRRIYAYDWQIQKLGREEFPETELLRKVPGVGPLTALAFVATIEDPARFPVTRQVGSFLGVRPRKDQSGETDRQLGITKAGDSHLRRLLVGSAQYILGPFGPDTDLRTWGLKLAARGGKNAKKRAVVAVARKLAVLLLTLWKNKATYEPNRQKPSSAEASSPAVDARLESPPPSAPPAAKRRPQSCAGTTRIQQ